MGTGTPQEHADRGNVINPSTQGLCTIQHNMAQNGALSAFLGVSALQKSQHLLLALLWPPGKGIWRGLSSGGGGEPGYPSTPLVLDDLARWVCCNTLLQESRSQAIATGRGESEWDTGINT